MEIFEKIYDKSDGLSLSDRFKKYEKLTQKELSKEYPTVIRLDGHKFNKLTERLKKNQPFSDDFNEIMYKCCKDLMLVSQSDLAYVASDEISLITKPKMNRNNIDLVDIPFSGKIQKLTTLYSGYLSSDFTLRWNQLPIDNIDKYDTLWTNEIVFFDARAFNIPKHEVLNYIMSRQISTKTNCVSQYADFYVGKKSTQNINSKEKIELIKSKGIDFDKICKPYHMYGTLMISNSNDLTMDLRRSKLDPELIKLIEYEY